MIAGIFNRHSCLRCEKSTVSSQQRLRLNKVSRRWQVLRASGPLREFQEQELASVEGIGEEDLQSISITAREQASAALQSLQGGLLGITHPTKQSPVRVQLYSGSISSGDLAGTSVTLKEYPAAAEDGDAELLLANEIAAHKALQQQLAGLSAVPGSEHVVKLLGTAERPMGRQALVLRRDATMSAESYCIQSAEQLFQARGPTDEEYWQGAGQPQLLQRKLFVKQAIHQLLEGLHYMHQRDRVHAGLLPRNLLLSRGHQESQGPLLVQLSNLSLSADVSDSALMGGATLAEIWNQNKLERDDPLKTIAEPIWRRARQAGARSPKELRAFAIAEDMLAAGILVAFLAFVPFCAPGSIDFTTVQRVFGVTFQSELGAAREYCEAEEQWTQAVNFLGEDIAWASAWDVIQSCVFPDWRLRPTAESCLRHPFLADVAKNR